MLVHHAFLFVLPPAPPSVSHRWTALAAVFQIFYQTHSGRRFDTRGFVAIFAANLLYFPLGGGILVM
jgi:hypothetical protein